MLENIYSLVISEKIDPSSKLMLNERVSEILKEVNVLFDEILADKHNTLDLLETKLKKVYTTLGKITGETETEEIIDLIFSKFCLGK